MFLLFGLQRQSTFEQLKLALTTAPVLSLPDFSQQFVIETDACDAGVGAVLLQKGHPIAFMSKGLSTYENEYMAMLLAVEQWRTYLQHVEFLILTDHNSLAHLEDQSCTQLGNKMCSPNYWAYSSK